MIDAIPPQDLECEQAILGAALQNGHALEIMGMKLTVRDFYRPQHAELFTALAGMAERKDRVDLLTVQSCLRDRGQLESCGGAGYLVQLMNCVPAPSNADYYAKVVLDKAVRRRLIGSAAEIQRLAFDDEQEIEEVEEKAARSIRSAIGECLVSPNGHFPEHVDAVLKVVAERRLGNRYLTGVSTGLSALDYHTRGLNPGELTVLAASTSMGKTTLALNIARSVAEEGAVLLYSLEMNASDLICRLIAADTGIDLGAIRGGNLSMSDMDRVERAATYLKKLPITLEDSGNVSVARIRNTARGMEERPALIVVDYLQLLNLSQGKGENRAQVVGQAAWAFKELAREIKCPIILLSQLNRQVVSRDGNTPNLSDLRESGDIENHADNVWFIYCPDYYRKPEGPMIRECEASIIIAKQRQGARNVTAAVYFQAFCTRFCNLARAGGPEPPAPIQGELHDPFAEDA